MPFVTPSQQRKLLRVQLLLNLTKGVKISLTVYNSCQSLNQELARLHITGNDL